MLISLSQLPNNLKSLCCSNNKLEKLPQLPKKLIELYCSNNKLNNLPIIPNELKILFCENNILSIVPNLPDTITTLYFSNNQVDYLTNIPTSIIGIKTHRNNIIERQFGSKISIYLLHLNKYIEENSKIRINNRNKIIFEELMIICWHPDRVRQLLNLGITFENM